MVQPQVLGGLCIACDRRSRVGPRLQELNQDSSTFKDRKFMTATQSFDDLTDDVYSTNAIP